MCQERLRLALRRRPPQHAAATLGLPARATWASIVAADTRHSHRIARGPDGHPRRRSGPRMARSSGTAASMAEWDSSLDRPALAADGAEMMKFSVLRREIEAATNARGTAERTRQSRRDVRSGRAATVTTVLRPAQARRDGGADSCLEPAPACGYNGIHRHSSVGSDFCIHIGRLAPLPPTRRREGMERDAMPPARSGCGPTEE